MLRHDSRSSVFLWFAQDNVNFRSKETSQLDNATILCIKLRLEWIESNQMRELKVNLIDMEMASVTMRRVVVGAVRKSGMNAIQRTQVV